VEMGKRKRDFSLRRPTHSQERRVGASTSQEGAARSAELVFGFWGDAGSVAKVFHEAVALGFSRALLEKVGGCFHCTDFLSGLAGGSDAENVWPPRK
jgi:hypothetical protein